MGADNGKPALSRSLWRVLVEARAKASGVVWVSRCLFSCWITRRVRENEDRFDSNIKTDLGGIILPDREGVTREGDWEFFFFTVFTGVSTFIIPKKSFLGGEEGVHRAPPARGTPRK